MDQQDVLKVCRKFIPKTDPATGKTRCVNLIPCEDGQHLCALPNEFMCTVAQYMNNLKMRQDYQTRGFGLWSVSRIDAMACCPRRYWLQHVLHLEQPPIKAFWLGNQFSKARARIVGGLQYELDDAPDFLGGNDAMMADRIKLEEILRAMSLKGGWPTGPNEEHISTVVNEKIAVHGYTDQRSPDGKIIYEWKYAMAPSMYNLVTIHPQASMYLKCMPNAEEFHLWVAKKSLLKMAKAGKPTKTGKPGKDAETPDAFRARVREKLESTQLFFPKIYRRAEFDIDGQFREFGMTIDYIERCEASGTWPKNTKHCEMCPMSQHCRDKYGMKSEDLEDDESDETSVAA